MRRVPEIKLIRTDTTLDLSQKDEKVCFGSGRAGAVRAPAPGAALTGDIHIRLACPNRRALPGQTTQNPKVRMTDTLARKFFFLFPRSLKNILRRLF